MRIGFRHCLLSSCLFRCGAGSLCRAVEPQPGWQTQLPHRWAQPCSHASPAPTLHSLPCLSCRRGQHWSCAQHCVPTASVPKAIPWGLSQGRFLLSTTACTCFSRLGENTKINVNKCSRMVQCHHPVMKTSGRRWEHTVVFLLLFFLSLPVVY